MEPLTTDAEKTKKKLELAQQLFKEYYATCFWHFDPNLVISEASLPSIIRGLRLNGGHRGWFASVQLDE